MKFGKILKTTSENLFPEMATLFLRYKELKKKLKAIPFHQSIAEGKQEGSSKGSANGGGSEVLGSGTVLSAEEQQFIATLNEDLARFNQYFIEKEEDAVIRLQVLADKVAAAAGDQDQLGALKPCLVDFHGEVVLLLHWSLLNYAAVVKILKKHDKRSGVLLRAPYLANVLQQPFASTTIMSRLVKRAEELVQATLTPGQLILIPEGGSGSVAGGGLGLGLGASGHNSSRSTPGADAEGDADGQQQLQERHQWQRLTREQGGDNEAEEQGVTLQERQAARQARLLRSVGVDPDDADLKGTQGFNAVVLPSLLQQRRLAVIGGASASAAAAPTAAAAAGAAGAVPAAPAADAAAAAVVAGALRQGSGEAPQPPATAGVDTSASEASCYTAQLGMPPGHAVTKTIVALQTWTELGRNAVTPSTVATLPQSTTSSAAAAAAAMAVGGGGSGAAHPEESSAAAAAAAVEGSSPTSSCGTKRKAGVAFVEEAAQAAQ